MPDTITDTGTFYDVIFKMYSEWNGLLRKKPVIMIVSTVEWGNKPQNRIH